MLIILTRILALAYIAFLAIMALDIFNVIGLSPMEKGIAFIIHLVPAFLAAVCLAVAWKQKLIGGALFLALAVGFTLFFHTYRDIGGFMVVSLPLVVIGGLFVWEGMRVK